MKPKHISNAFERLQHLHVYQLHIRQLVAQERDDARIHVLNAQNVCSRLALDVGVLRQSRYSASIERVLVSGAQ